VRHSSAAYCETSLTGGARPFVRKGHGITVLAFVILAGCHASPSAADAKVALTPLRTIPLAAARTTGQINLNERIPDDAQWKRLISAWGEPGYVIAVVSPDHRTVACFDKFHLNPDLTSNSRSISSWPAPPLYGYSADCANSGLEFHADAGTLVGIRIGVPDAASAQPDELILVANWGPKTKDRLVSVGIDEELFGAVRRWF
jgi:hypothetical protein